MTAILDAKTALELLPAAVGHTRASVPLVQCITNTVVQNVTANVLLAASQAPAMVDHPEEAGQFAGIASGVLINVGTIAPAQIEAMKVAAKAANSAGTAWVLDPVAVGGLSVRTQLAAELLEEKPAAIRGNASEISALAGLGAGGRGVDSTDSVEDAIPAAIELARRTGAVVAISGPRDAIVWVSGGEDRVLLLESGHELMPRVIGTGCSLGAVIAGYVGAARTGNVGADAGLEGVDSTALAVLAAHAHLGAAGSKAGETAKHPGSFAVAWIDALDSLSADDIAAAVSVTDGAQSGEAK